MPISLRQIALIVICLVLDLGCGKGLARGEEQVQQSPRYTVWVYRNLNGKWVKQDDRTLVTEDRSKAIEYESQFRDRKDWTATSNISRVPDNGSRASNIITREGNYAVLVKSISRDGMLTVAVEPTGRSVKIPLKSTVGRIKSPGGYEDATSIVGKQVLLSVRTRVAYSDRIMYADGYMPLDHIRPTAKPLLKLLGEIEVHQTERCERILGDVLTTEYSNATSHAFDHVKQRWVIGRLKPEEGINLADIECQVEMIDDGVFRAFVNEGDKLTFRHAGCMPVNLTAHPESGRVIEEVRLVRFTPENSGKLLLPLSDFALKEITKDPPPDLPPISLVVTKIPKLHDEDSPNTWSGFLEAPTRDTSLDIPLSKPSGKLLEVQVAPGEYLVHCYSYGRDRYLQRITVAAGDTQTLPTLELPPPTYAVAQIAAHDGKRADIEKAQKACFVSDLYSHIVTHQTLSGVEVRYTMESWQAWTSRDRQGRIVLCVTPGDDVKIADLGKGTIKDFAELGGHRAVWKKDEELYLEKRRLADIYLANLGGMEALDVICRSVPIHKGHVYRFDGKDRKYLVEITEVTADFPTYAEAIKNLVRYDPLAFPKVP